MEKGDSVMKKLSFRSVMNLCFFLPVLGVIAFSGIMTFMQHRGMEMSDPYASFEAMVEKCEPTEGLAGAPKYTLTLVGQDMILHYVRLSDGVFAQEEILPGTRVLVKSYDKWYWGRHPGASSQTFIWFAEPLKAAAEEK